MVYQYQLQPASLSLPTVRGNPKKAGRESLGIVVGIVLRAYSTAVLIADT